MLYNQTMNIIQIFLSGAGILIGALLLNFLASALGLMSWYDFVKGSREAGLWSYLWLFLLYPLGLGLSAYLSAKLLNLL